MKKVKYIFLVAIVFVYGNINAQGYLKSYFGYFSSELSYGTNVSHEHPDTMSLAAELSIDSLNAIDLIEITVSDSLDSLKYSRIINVISNSDTTRYLDSISTTFQIPIDNPHIFRINVPTVQVSTMRLVAVRFKLKAGYWINVVNQNI